MSRSGAHRIHSRPGMHAWRTWLRRGSSLQMENGTLRMKPRGIVANRHVLRAAEATARGCSQCAGRRRSIGFNAGCGATPISSVGAVPHGNYGILRPHRIAAGRDRATKRAPSAAGTIHRVSTAIRLWPSSRARLPHGPSRRLSQIARFRTTTLKTRGRSHATRRPAPIGDGDVAERRQARERMAGAPLVRTAAAQWSSSARIRLSTASTPADAYGRRRCAAVGYACARPKQHMARRFWCRRAAWRSAGGQ